MGTKRFHRHVQTWLDLIEEIGVHLRSDDDRRAEERIIREMQRRFSIIPAQTILPKPYRWVKTLCLVKSTADLRFWGIGNKCITFFFHRFSKRGRLGAAVGKGAESICSHVVLQICKKYWVVYLCLHQNRGMHEMLYVCRVFVWVAHLLSTHLIWKKSADYCREQCTHSCKETTSLEMPRTSPLLGPPSRMSSTGDSLADSCTWASFVPVTPWFLIWKIRFFWLVYMFLYYHGRCRACSTKEKREDQICIVSLESLRYLGISVVQRERKSVPVPWQLFPAWSTPWASFFLGWAGGGAPWSLWRNRESKAMALFVAVHEELGDVSTSERQKAKTGQRILLAV